MGFGGSDTSTRMIYDISISFEPSDRNWLFHFLTKHNKIILLSIYTLYQSEY